MIVSKKFNLDTFYLYEKKYKEANKLMIYESPQGFKMYITFMSEFKDMLYNLIHIILEPVCKTEPEAESLIRAFANEIETKYYNEYVRIIKIYQHLIEDDMDIDIYSAKIKDIEDTLYSIMAMRSLKHFAFYMERSKPPKDRIWGSTMVIFESYFWYTQRMILKQDIEKIRASYFPGAGKTYAGNLTCAFWFGYDINMSILRITYSDDLAKQFVMQTADMIKSDQYKKVFPRFNKEEREVFAINNAGGFKLRGSNVYNLYATTTNGQSTGKRAKLLMIDDVSKGVEEAYKIDVHNYIISKYDGNWSSRGDGDTQLQILLGTMWSPYDLLNEIMNRAKKHSQIYDSIRFKYVKVNAENEKDVKEVFIAVPILDYKTDTSTCPKRYSTELMRKKRDDFKDKELFEAVYQQNPLEPSALIFGYSRLNTYKTIPFGKDAPFECKGMIDPAKVGKDYCAFGVFKRWYKLDGTWSDWYLIDAVYKQDTVENLYDLIVEKIIKHGLTELGGELNTNSSLLYVIKRKCAERGYTSLRTLDVWSYENKESKILGAKMGVLNLIIYPSQELFSARNDLGLGMIHFTTYDITGRNAHDDFVDMVSMFVIKFCKGKTRNFVQILDRNIFNLR